jgi:hypothetical protein
VTVRRGTDWGGPGQLAPDRPVFDDDAAFGAYVAGARARGEPIGDVGLLGGDLCRTVGGPGDRARLVDGRAVRLPIDVVRAELDGAPAWFVAHLVAHRPGWRGQAAVAMNAEWLGEWKLGPRAHPGDGLVDVTSGALRWRDRRRARARARSGDHLPHPALTVVRAATTELHFARPTPVWLDGRPAARSRHIVLTVEPDAAAIVV